METCKRKPDSTSITIVKILNNCKIKLQISYRGGCYLNLNGLPVITGSSPVTKYLFMTSIKCLHIHAL